MVVVAGALRLFHPRRESLAQFAGLAALIALAALTQHRTRDWRDPISLWSATVEESPDSSRSWNALGAQLRNADRKQEAEAAFLRSIELQPGLWDALFNLGTLHLEYASEPDRNRAAELAQARHWLEKSLEPLPDSQRSRWCLADVLYNQRDFGAAEEIYVDLASEDERFHEGSRIPLGRIALLTGRLDIADAYFDEAMAKRDDRLNAVLGLSVAAEMRDDKKKAIEITRGALTSHRASPLPWLRMAELHAGTAAARGYLHQASERGYEVTDAQRAALLPRDGR